MTENEAGRVLAAIAGAWPQVTVTEDTAAVWFNAALKGCDFELGVDVALEIVREEERFPTPAVFNARVRRRHEQAAVEEAKAKSARSLAGPPISDDEARGNVDRLKQLLSTATVKVVPRAQRKIEAEQPVAAAPPQPCPLADHSRCGAGPVEVHGAAS